MTGNFHLLAVKEAIQETDDAVSFVLEVPADKQNIFKYSSGQFLTVHIGLEAGEVQRCYSLSSVHGHDADLKITVKRVASGPGSNWLVDNVKTGGTLAVMRPAGIFVSRHPDRDLALFAAGSGITPIMSLLRHRLHTHPTAKAFLFYANRDEQSVIFKSQLNALASQYPDRLQIVHFLESVQGRPSMSAITGFAKHLAECENFICGPAPFMDVVAATLEGLCVDKQRVHLERFVFATPTAAKAVASAKVVSSTGQPLSQLEITLDGVTKMVPWHEGEFMLDAIQRAGMNPPHSCRSGECGACICTLESGEVDMRANAILDKADLADKMILACQSIPKSPHVKAAF